MNLERSWLLAMEEGGRISSIKITNKKRSKTTTVKEIINSRRNKKVVVIEKLFTKEMWIWKDF